MELAKPVHVFLHRIPILLAVALLAGALVAHAGSRHLGGRASALAGSLTGMEWLMSSVGPCLPCGLKASDVTIRSASGVPLLQAKELRAQLNPLRILQTNRNPSDLFDTLQGDQVQLSLNRNENGEWELPGFLGSQQNKEASVPAAHGCRRRCCFTNVTIVVKTAKGEASRFYHRMEGEIDPGTGSATLKLSGADESAKIRVSRGAVTRYEIQSENFSPALLAPVSDFPLPLGSLALNGSLRASTSDHTSFAMEGNGSLTIRSLHSPLLTSGTIDGFILPFDLKAKLTGSGIEGLAARISLGGERAFVQGSIRGWEQPVLDLTTTFADFSYDRAVSALPPSAHPDLPVIRLSGSMTGTFSLHLDLTDPDSLDYRYTGRTDRPQIMDLGQGFDLDRLKGPFLHKTRMKPGEEVTILVAPDNPDFTPYGKIPFSLRSAVLATEDMAFYSHGGFSTSHIRGSLIENLKAGRVVRGASTITMQLAKNLFLSPERTVTRKLEEAILTLALEQSLDKKRILEIYLNVIEWGDGIYGIGPAARHYFGKRPAELTPVESAFLASIIPRPRNWYPNPLSRLRSWGHLQAILCKMYRMGAAGVEDLDEAGVSEAAIDRLLQEEFERERTRPQFEDQDAYPQTTAPTTPVSYTGF